MRRKLVGLVAMALVVASCGGDEPLTMEQYFQQVEDIVNQTVTEMGAASAEFQGVLDDDAATTEARDAAYVALHRRNRDAFDDERQALAALTPPAAAVEEHQAMVDAVQVMVESLDRAIASWGEAPSPEEINNALDDEGVLEGNSQLMATCVDLKEIAEEAGIAVTLPC